MILNPPQNEHNITWMKCRGSYFIDERTPQFNRIFGGVIFVSFFPFFFLQAGHSASNRWKFRLRLHLYSHVLRSAKRCEQQQMHFLIDHPRFYQSSMRSLQAAHGIRNSLVVLFCQVSNKKKARQY